MLEILHVNLRVEISSKVDKIDKFCMCIREDQCIYHGSVKTGQMCYIGYVQQSTFHTFAVVLLPNSLFATFNNCILHTSPMPPKDISIFIHLWSLDIH